MSTLSNLIADWPAPATIRALTTLRHSGFSQPPYDKNNLGLHVGDNPEHVLRNRRELVDSLRLPGEPAWLDQTHSTTCVVVEENHNRRADAAITRDKQQVLAIMTADCLPILLCNRQGTEIAAIHAGWRGLVNGIVENTVQAMQSQPADLMAWIGPGICQSCYEVGDDMRSQFKSRYDFSLPAFQKKDSKWLADLPGLAALVLENLSIPTVSKSNLCTFEQKNDFYSYRREPQTGRMATLIWFT
ncbi:Laccase domain protein yfiH [Legionella taurinensis]|nr:Laccase domain protein yfiH [Legionella taurinensis]